MKQKLSAGLIGLITGILMIVFVLTVYTVKLKEDSPFHFFLYIIYAAGIVWAIVRNNRKNEGPITFWNAFTPGFRAFIITILVLVAFTIIFNKLHPEFITESAALYKEMLVKQKGKTPVEIEEMVDGFKNGYLTMLVYRSIFGYLIIGAIVTAITAAITTRRK